MIPYELDPSLHAAPPAPERFDDGFAPPPPDPLPDLRDAPIRPLASPVASSDRPPG